MGQQVAALVVRVATVCTPRSKAMAVRYAVDDTRVLAAETATVSVAILAA